MISFPTIFRLLTLWLLAALTLGLTSTTNSVTPNEILSKSFNRVNAGSTYSEMTIKIVRPRWSRTVELATWTKGNEQALAVVMKPEKDKGMVFLKKGGEVWNYLPKINSTVKLPSSMMGQNWMGSDLSNGDLLKQLSDPSDFDLEMMSDAVVNGESCYRISLTPKPETPIVWGKIVTSISKTDLIQMKTEFYDEDEDLVSTMTGSNIKLLGGVKLASVYTMIPADKPGHKTIVTTRKLEFNPSIGANFFTIASAKELDI